MASVQEKQGSGIDLRGWLGAMFSGPLIMVHLMELEFGGLPFSLGMLALSLPPVWSRVRERFPRIPEGLRWWGVIICFFASALYMPDKTDAPGSAVAAQADAETIEVANDPLSKARAKLGEDAILLMDRENYPDNFAKFGKARFEEANELTEWAALAAAESDQCPKVDNVGVSVKANRQEIKWYVDCSNGERFKIDEDQTVAARDRLSPDTPADRRAKAEQLAIAEPVSARWKDFSESMAVTMCDTVTESAMLIPSTFDTAWGWDIAKDDETGMVTIQRDYEAENAYGMEINSRYHCELDGDAMEIKKLLIREPGGWRKLL